MRKPRFTLEQLRSFVAVAELENVSRAAGSLFLTQAAVTQQLRHFEGALGLQLFERDRRRIRLTDAGRLLAETCRAALRGVEVVDDSALELKDLRAGSLQFGASPTCATYYAPQHLAEFARRHPGIKLAMTVEPSAELNRAVLVGTLDCALIEADPDPALVAHEITRDELLLLAHRDHPLARMRQVTDEALSRHLYLGRGPQWSAEGYVRRMLGDVYDRVNALNLGHPEYVRAALLAGLGFAALPRRAVADDLARGLVKRLRAASIVRPITGVRRSARGGQALEAFWTLLTGAGIRTSARISTDANARG